MFCDSCSVHGSRDCIVRVMTMVVIKNLSAAGSSILPSTVPILYLRAIHPSSCRMILIIVSSENENDGAKKAHEICHTCDKEQRRGDTALTRENIVTNDGSESNAGKGERIGKRVDVFTELSLGRTLDQLKDSVNGSQYYPSLQGKHTGAGDGVECTVRPVVKRRWAAKGDENPRG